MELARSAKNSGIKFFHFLCNRFISEDKMVSQTEEYIEKICQRYNLSTVNMRRDTIKGFYSRNEPIEIFDEYNEETLFLFLNIPKTKAFYKVLLRQYGNVFFVRVSERENSESVSIIVDFYGSEYTKDLKENQNMNQSSHNNDFSQIFEDNNNLKGNN